jgi:hypothetical protein
MGDVVVAMKEKMKMQAGNEQISPGRSSLVDWWKRHYV